MNLQSASYSARSALLLNSVETALVSRNISGANDANYARRSLQSETSADGSVRGSYIERATDAALRNAMLSSTSKSESDAVVSAAMTSLQSTVGNPQDGTSPAALIGSLQAALRQAAAAPQDGATLTAAVGAARSVATALNSASSQTQLVRAQADASMKSSVDKIQSLLKQFESVNATIVTRGRASADAPDAMDSRDAILADLSKEVGIKTVVAPDGGTSIFTDSGVTLFQDKPRTVTMTPSATLSAGVSGASVYVDGVAIAGVAATMPTQSGSLAGNAYVRDVAGPKYQAQLDEIARGLVSAFSQADQSATPTMPDRTGLFNWSGGPSVPQSSVGGISASLVVDSSVDPNAGGDATLLRDGGIGLGSGSVYAYNQQGGASFSDRLSQLANEIDATHSFDSNAGIGTSSSLNAYATASTGWLESQRQTYSDASAQSSAVASQAKSTLSNATGVNIDDQMALMLGLEHSYQASAKMMATIDTMYSTFFRSLVGTA